ncbi:MAG: phosphatidylglycerophosphatase A [bacterium]
MPLSVRHLRHPEVLWASGLGLGFCKPAPGTWGSVGAIVVWWLFLADFDPLIQVLICIAYFISGWVCSTLVTRNFGVDDAAEIVADEVAGMWLAVAFLPRLWWLILLAFVLFRLLDILKPGPIGWLDREVKGGLGVMLDDLLAGAVVAIVLYVAVLSLQTAGLNPITR